MARTLKLDTIDFAKYEQATEAQSKVKPAATFADDIVRSFEPTAERAPTIRSKLRGLLEFRPGEVTCWAGYNGHRKSMYVGQVVLDLCAQDQRVLVASMEMLPWRTLARMARQASANATPTREDIDRFATWTSDRLWLLDHMGRIAPAQMVAICRYFRETLRGQHVVIDSMMMVCASEEHMDEQKQFITDLCRVAQETGLHVHVVTHCRKPSTGNEDKPPTKYDVRGTSAITDQIGNVVIVWANKAKAMALERAPGDGEWIEKPDAYVTVEKQRNGSWEGRAQFWFDDASLRFVDDRLTAVAPMIFMRWLSDEQDR